MIDKLVERFKSIISDFKIFLTPTKVVEIRNGNGKNKLKMNRPYIWKILLLTATPMLNRWFDIMNLIAAVKGVHPLSL